MASRSIAQVAPTSTSIAMNAYIFAYAGHSLVTPHATLKQIWWTDERIEAKATRQYILSKLRGQEREFLNRGLAFGEGLTDATYMEWILGKAKRLFVILADVGVPDQIFGCIDDCWGDEDLPLSKEEVISLDLSYERDDALDQRFYDRQFTVLLRELAQGAHINYGPNEHIPMDFVDSVAVAASIQSWDRIRFPGRPEAIYMRRKFALSEKETEKDYRQSFMRDVRKAIELSHRHIAPVWASYTSGNAGYVLFDLVGAHTLQSFIDHRTPPQWMRVPGPQRPFRLCEWMHCLADALAFLHDRGTAHTAIRPSNIIIDDDNHIAFADIGSLRTFQRGKKINPAEVYDYAAPETPMAQTPIMSQPGSPPSDTGLFGKRLRRSSSISSGYGVSAGGIPRSDSLCSIQPDIHRKLRAPASASSLPSPLISSASSIKSSTPFLRNFSRHITGSSQSLRACRPLVSPTPTQKLPDVPDIPAIQSDIFSLGCVFLDTFTFLLRGKTTDFVKHRTTQPLPSKVDGSNNNTTKRIKNDPSFHASPAVINEWTLILESDARKILSSPSAPSSPIYRAAPSFLALIKHMLSSNPAARPTAIEVRDQLTEILTMHCKVPLRNLCCGEKAWNREDEAIGEDITMQSLYHSRFSHFPLQHMLEEDELPPTSASTFTSPHQHQHQQRQKIEEEEEEAPATNLMDVYVSPVEEKQAAWFDELNAIAAAKGLSERPKSAVLPATQPWSMSSKRVEDQRAAATNVGSTARRQDSAIASGSGSGSGSVDGGGRGQPSYQGEADDNIAASSSSARFHSNDAGPKSSSKKKHKSNKQLAYAPTRPKRFGMIALDEEEVTDAVTGRTRGATLPLLLPKSSSRPRRVRKDSHRSSSNQEVMDDEIKPIVGGARGPVIKVSTTMTPIASSSPPYSGKGKQREGSVAVASSSSGMDANPAVLSSSSSSVRDSTSSLRSMSGWKRAFSRK